MTRAQSESNRRAGALAAEIAAWEALLQVLDIESRALCRLDADAIIDAAAAKQRHVQALEELAHARSPDPAANDPEFGDDSLAAWLRGDTNVTATPAEWNELKAIAGRACVANARNGRLLSRQRKHFEQSRAALLRAAGAAPVYGADGRPQALHASRMHAAG